ncbi:MAG: flagellar hook-length control protein FliK [Candidatus Sericytochromatia bacterium]
MEMAQLFSSPVSSAPLAHPASLPEGGLDFRAQLQASLQAVQASIPPAQASGSPENISPELPVAVPEPLAAEEVPPSSAPSEEMPEITLEAAEPEVPLPLPVLIWEDFYRLQQPAAVAAPPASAAAVSEGLAPEQGSALSAVVPPGPQPSEALAVHASPEVPSASGTEAATEVAAEAAAQAAAAAKRPPLDAPATSAAAARPVRAGSANGPRSAAPPVPSAPSPEVAPPAQGAADTEALSLPAPAVSTPTVSAPVGAPVATPPVLAELLAKPALVPPGDTFVLALQPEAETQAPLVLASSSEPLLDVPESFQILEHQATPVVVPGREPVPASVPRSAHAELIQRFELVQQLSRHVDMTRLQQGVQRAELQLEPAHLGKLQLQLQQSAQQVSLQIITELPLAKELIEASLGQLRQHLAQQGLQLQQVQIHVQADLGSQAGFQQSADQPPSQAFVPQRRSGEAFDLNAPPPASDIPIPSPETVLQAVNTLV